MLIVFMLCVLYLLFIVCQSAFCHFANKVLLLLLQLLLLTTAIILKYKSCIERTFFRCLFGIVGLSRPMVPVIERLKAVRL